MAFLYDNHLIERENDFTFTDTDKISKFEFQRNDIIFKYDAVTDHFTLTFRGFARKHPQASHLTPHFEVDGDAESSIQAIISAIEVHPPRNYFGILRSHLRKLATIYQKEYLAKYVSMKKRTTNS